MSASTWLRIVGLCGLLIALTLVSPGWTQAQKGKRYALLVGVKTYDHRKLADLKYTENDAEALAEVLRKAGYDEVAVLTTSRGEKSAKAAPTRANIERELKRLLDKVTKRDVVLIALAGHGVQYEVKLDGKRKRDESFFCPSDARLINSDDFGKLCESMISFRKLFEQLDDSGAGSRLLLVDACRNEAGGTRNADADAMPSPTRGTAALFACKGGERAFESGKLGEGHGVFFYHVIEALKGRAKNKHGAVTWDGLTAHVRAEVAEAVPTLIGGGARQTPELMARLEGDPVLLEVGGVEEKVVKGQKEFTNGAGMRFVLVKKGKFMMGSPRQERGRSSYSEDQAEVEIPRDFYLGVTEVTQKQYKAVMGKNPSYFSKDGEGKDKVKGVNTDDFPVECISDDDAQTFIKRLNARATEAGSGVAYRLPTEVQWEYACRGGPDFSDKPFHFKTPFDSLSSKQANFDGAFPYGEAAKGPHLGRPCKVMSDEPNALGIYDMHGNVAEWCDSRDADSPPVRRGGGWFDIGQVCRAAGRVRTARSSDGYDLGFRVAAVAQE